MPYLANLKVGSTLPSPFSSLPLDVCLHWVTKIGKYVKTRRRVEISNKRDANWEDLGVCVLAMVPYPNMAEAVKLRAIHFINIICNVQWLNFKRIAERGLKSTGDHSFSRDQFTLYPCSTGHHMHP